MTLSVPSLYIVSLYTKMCNNFTKKGKAPFFEVCRWVGKNGERQTWQDVAKTEKDKPGKM